MSRRRSLLTALAALLLVTGCGAQVRPEATSAAAGYPVTVRNCGQDLTFAKVPGKVVAYDSGILEMLFALGLRDRIAGYVMPHGQNKDIEGSRGGGGATRPPPHRGGTDPHEGRLAARGGGARGGGGL
ncbi:hypothetical protein ACFWX6_19255, partial [Amycolatopsis sp. NPDC059019]